MYRTVVGNIQDADLNNDALGYAWSGTDEFSMFEVGAIIERDGWKRHIVLRLRDGFVRTISDSHQLYHALTYPLLFPTGCAGWHAAMEYNGRYLVLHEVVCKVTLPTDRYLWLSTCVTN